MVFESYGVKVAESEIRDACDCTMFGTFALAAVDAARSFGFVGTRKHTLSLSELVRLVAEGKYPVVLLSLKPIDGIRETHAVVVVAADDETVTVLDPMKGERTLAAAVFRMAWALRESVAIIVSR
jgi:ABC-type bacteriocin/lantibiotic exporter with double-glycine peptidase domain